MKKISLLFLFFSLIAMGQNKKISGKVVDVNQEPIPGANVIIIETGQGAVTDFEGVFHLKVERLPVTIEASYVGYKNSKITVSDNNPVQITLKENNEFLDDVVVTASRGKELIKESPVSIERMSLKEIKRNTAPSFYDGLANLKGVDINTNSLTFQSVNTRGFATFSNTRFVQLIDDMDNTSPALNFPLGNLVGMNELDVQSVEILPGAASALYGANAFNGILNMRSKNPFTYKGLSAYVKYGQTVQDAAGTNPYSDVGIRYAWGGDKAAAKINFSFLKGTDWLANDMSDYDSSFINANVRGSRASNPSYDGLNVYGDEIATDIDLNGLPAPFTFNEVIRVSRTGYAEKDLIDNEAKSVKADLAFHYRPDGQPGKLEFIWSSRFGTGKTLYQGSNRYAMNNIFIHQHKLEVKNKNWFVRAYYTGEDAGDTYDTRFTAWNINRKWRSDKDWFTDYAIVYSLSRQGLFPSVPGVHSAAEAHAIARDFADNSPYDLTGNPKTPRLIPGTPEYEKAFNEVISDPDFKTGGKFIDKTSLKHIEANYNFKNLIDVVEIQVGGSLRQFYLNSEGTLFTDYPGLDPIKIKQTGAYLQLTKKFLDDKLKITNSVRYDKQNNFDGSFTPRLSAVYSTGENKKHNFRLSFQKGFRNPTTQDLYIGLNLGPVSLVGAASDNLDRYSEIVNAYNPFTNTYFDAKITGNDAYHNAYTLESVMEFSQTGDPSKLVPADNGVVKPEQVQTIEFGYRGELINKLGMDFSVYYNTYNDFQHGKKVIAISSEVGNSHDNTGVNALISKAYKLFYLYSNTDETVHSYGLDVGFNYKIGDYNIGLIYDYAKLDFDTSNVESEQAGFNTPEHRIKFSVGNDKLFKNFGFKVDYRYQTEFLWESTFATKMLPARSILDAQISYNLKKYNMKFKLGGSNLTGKEYSPAPGTGMVGSIYYIGVTYGK
jgi:outer membrane receptor protein involved in Fe transport